MKRTWDELQRLGKPELDAIKQAELTRIDTAEDERQSVIRDIMVLQEIPDQSAWRKP